MVMPLVWLPFTAVDPLQKNTATTGGHGRSATVAIWHGCNRGKFEVQFLHLVAHNNLSHTNVYWACVLKHLKAQVLESNRVFRAHVSYFPLCPLTSNPKNLSLAGKNRNRTGKAMNLKSVSGISVRTNLSWWAYERSDLESTLENFWEKIILLLLQ